MPITARVRTFSSRSQHHFRNNDDMYSETGENALDAFPLSDLEAKTDTLRPEAELEQMLLEDESRLGDVYRLQVI